MSVSVCLRAACSMMMMPEVMCSAERTCPGSLLTVQHICSLPEYQQSSFHLERFWSCESDRDVAASTLVASPIADATT